MQEKINFFPPPFPDEFLISRVSRYHVMSGNGTYESTFLELFGRKGFGLCAVVPPHIDVLAPRLPGNVETSASEIIQDSTLLPLFRPFLGRPNKLALPLQKNDVNSEITHLPRRVVGMSGEMNLCLSCACEDEMEHGVAYWHRSHQIPGVAVCWKHREKLVNSCPNCRFPFQRLNRLLSIPWATCRCGTDIRTFVPLKTIDELEIAYSTYSHDLLMENIEPQNPEIIMSTYRAKIRERGFIRGSLPATSEFQDAMIKDLGAEFIRKVDPAFSANRTQSWLRLSYIESALDLPITRHLVLGMYLFESASNFRKCVSIQIDEQVAAVRKTNRKEPTNNVVCDGYRRKILGEKKKNPEITMERLWKKHFRAVAWLFDNDKIWLTKTTKVEANDAKDRCKLDENGDAEKDREYSQIANTVSKNIFEKQGKPERVSIGKILGGLPKRISSGARSRERFPLLFETIELCKETSWCFSARRILWALEELERIGEPILVGIIVSKSTVSHRAVEQIMQFCDWDENTLNKSAGNIKVILAKAGITSAWRGPSDSQLGEFSGRSYNKKTLS